MPRDLDDRPTALYRLRDDASRLLYVGITTDPEERFRQHASLSPWWSLVTDRSIEWHTTRPSAEEAEGIAIRDEAPLYNRAGSGGPDAVAADFPVGEEVSISQLRARLADVVHASAVGGQITFITKNGRPFVAFVPVDVAEAHEAKQTA
ncbi:hypothetical protein DIZ27_14565 [Streptomyces sp. NWU339]|uniref:type II toxin-antitoxin system prevent-host-death family antitoxin n=1 Tax=Streptomyces sp. NWU339 TaxID=2185284 RepID=UPI000D684277|nr:type II toxin-antitoxin system prevent-host-death family antitoxin [Streptomyces sp. NWU339]PWI09756.1 hypothetical protein DIZ27_14565 [Streptomyces sp. NWU339]